MSDDRQDSGIAHGSFDASSGSAAAVAVAELFIAAAATKETTGTLFVTMSRSLCRPSQGRRRTVDVR